jgi:hypothetical protein
MTTSSSCCSSATAVSERVAVYLAPDAVVSALIHRCHFLLLSVLVACERKPAGKWLVTKCQASC